MLIATTTSFNLRELGREEIDYDDGGGDEKLREEERFLGAQVWGEQRHQTGLACTGDGAASPEQRFSRKEAQLSFWIWQFWSLFPAEHPFSYPCFFPSWFLLKVQYPVVEVYHQQKQANKIKGYKLFKCYIYLIISNIQTNYMCISKYAIDSLV